MRYTYITTDQVFVLYLGFIKAGVKPYKEGYGYIWDNRKSSYLVWESDEDRIDFLDKHLI